MHKLLLTLLTCIPLATYGQTAYKQTDITSTKTSKHINIPGTRLFIIPPSGFTISKDIKALMKDNNTGITVTDIEGDDFYSDTTFNEREFEKEGITASNYQEFKLNNFSAKYLELDAAGNGHFIAILFGDATFSTLVMGVNLSSDNKAEKDIQQALSTIYYDKNFKAKTPDIPFTIDVSKSPFKFARTVSETIIYTVGGKIDEEDTESPMIIFTPISKIPAGTKASPEDVSQKLITKIERDSTISTKARNMAHKRINDQPAYEVEIYTKSEGLVKLIYQVVILKDDKMLIIQAIASNDFETNLKTFKSLVQTIKLK